MINFPKKHTFFFWQNRIKIARSMDTLNEIENGINRQINQNNYNQIGIDLSEQTIIELWNLCKEKRKRYLAQTAFYKGENLIGF